MENLLTVKEAAAVSRMSESWWRQRIFREEVPFVRIGRKVLIPESTVDGIQKRIQPRSNSKYSKEV